MLPAMEDNCAESSLTGYGVIYRDGHIFQLCIRYIGRYK
jgi:hypothetical protein